LRNLIYKALEDQSGFQGQVSGLHLVDIIQLNCISNSTGSLSVKRGNEEGTIYFVNGNIVHTQCNDIVGEEAFYEILSWKGGNFTNRKGHQAKKRTIDKNWSSLILEGMHRIDEAEDIEKPTDESKLADQLKISLTGIMNIPGVLAAAVIDAEGTHRAILMSKKMEGKVDLDAIGEQVTSGVKYGRSLIKDFKTSSFERITLEYQDKTVITNVFPDREDVLMIITESRANLGSIRLQLKKVIKKIIEILPDLN